MTKNITFFSIIVLLLSCGQEQLLMAQSAPNRGASRSFNALAIGHAAHSDLSLPAATMQDAGDQADAVALGLAKTKVYKFRSIDYPGATSSDVYDFNGKTAVGEFYSPFSAFTFQGTSYAPLNIPGAIYSSAYGINTSGEIVGEYEDSSDNGYGFLYDGSGYTTINYPGSGLTQAWDINDAGLIVGYYIDSTGVHHGFLYDKGTFTAIDFPGADGTSAYGINSSGDIVGTYSLAGIQNGFLLKDGRYSTVDFPEADNTQAFGINDGGDIAGFYYGTDARDYGFTYAGGTFHEVVVPGALETVLFRIKNNGNVVGVVADSLGEEHGIIGR